MSGCTGMTAMRARFVAIGDAASILSVCVRTLRRWDKRGKLKPAFRTAGGHRRYSLEDIRRFAGLPAEFTGIKGGSAACRTAAVYARVSSSKQKKRGDLKRQIEKLTGFCRKGGFKKIRVYSDVGSGLNDRRRGLMRLLGDAFRGKFGTVAVTYNDRLTRFGIGIIRAFLEMIGVELRVMHPVIIDDDENGRLITDLTAILYSFMGRLYRSVPCGDHTAVQIRQDNRRRDAGCRFVR